MIGCGIYISCGVTKKNKNTGGNEHVYLGNLRIPLSQNIFKWVYK